MKNLIIILIIILTQQINLINGQNGYISLKIHDENNNSSSYSVEFKRLDKQNLEPIIEFQFFETVYELEKGSYSITVNGTTGYTTGLNSFVREQEIIDTFEIIGNDTIILELITKFDTIYPTKETHIEEIDLKGEFYCQYLDCVDKNGKRNGLQFGRYCDLRFGTISFIEIYTQDRPMMRILTKGDDLTYCQDKSEENIKQFQIVNFRMNDEQIMKFIAENFQEGQMKNPLTHNGKILKPIE